MMKKTLVALAAVAVTGGAFAQATMTGAVGFGFQSDTTSANVTTSGFGVEAAKIVFDVSEPLDGGAKLSANFGISVNPRSTPSGRDFSLTYAAANGIKVVGSTTEGGDYLTNGIAGAGADFEADMSYTGMVSKTSNDAVSVSFPVAEGMTLKITHQEPDYAIGTGAAQAASSLATTTTAAGLIQGHNTASLGYKAGQLVADVGYRTYTRQEGSSTVYVASKTRGSVSYDLGAAKIGFGVDANTYTYGNTKNNSAFGITIPLGNLTLGAQMLTIQASGNATASSNYTRNGGIVGGMYTLSKRTYMTAQTWVGDLGGTYNDTGYLVSVISTF